MDLLGEVKDHIFSKMFMDEALQISYRFLCETTGTIAFFILPVDCLMEVWHNVDKFCLLSGGIIICWL